MKRTLALLMVSLGCAPSVPADYARSAAAAGRAYAHGRYDEAATRWAEAEQRAESVSDAHEARYRRAASLHRAGRVDAARKALEAVTEERLDRSARALNDLAEIDEQLGNEEAAARQRDALITRFPQSGLASVNVQRRVRSIRERSGEQAVRRYLSSLLGKMADAPVAERIGYELARSEERDEHLSEAVQAYRRVARRFPYPSGALWDDAVYRAAMLDARLGHPERAIADLRAMLSHREQAAVTGSYERPRYAEARFAIGELWRDALGDDAEARRAFLELWSSHESSRLRDDAKWQAALIAARTGARDAACADVRELARSEPESRFVPCARLVCPSASASRMGACHGYIEREAEAVLAGRKGDR